MPAPLYNWEDVDKSEWGKKPDTIIAEGLGVHKSVIAYWREKNNIPSYDDYLKIEKQNMFNQGFGWCSKCSSYLPIEMFGKYTKGPLGVRTNCKKCRAKYRNNNREEITARSRSNYIHNREKVLERNLRWREQNRQHTRDYMRTRQNRLRGEFLDLFGSRCSRCGYDEFTSGLDFHHVVAEGKEHTPQKVINSGDYERAYKEIDKCALLCRCCHQALHSGDWDCEFEKVDFGWKTKN